MFENKFNFSKCYLCGDCVCHFCYVTISRCCLLTVPIRAFSFNFICLIKVENYKYFVVVHWQKSASDLLEEETRQLKLNGISCSKQTTNIRNLDIVRVTGKVSCKHILYHIQYILFMYVLMHILEVNSNYLCML